MSTASTFATRHAEKRNIVSLIGADRGREPEQSIPPPPMEPAPHGEPAV